MLPMVDRTAQEAPLRSWVQLTQVLPVTCSSAAVIPWVLGDVPVKVVPWLPQP